MTEQQFTSEEIEREEWRPVVNFETWYEVSDLGRVRRRIRPDRPLAPGLKKGYCGVSLCVRNRITQRLVHTLVAEAFLGMPPDGMEVSHEDNNRSNNRLENLRYVTHAQNMQHCAATTGHTRGERNPFATTTEAQAMRVKRMLQVGGVGLPTEVIAVCVGVSIHVVHQIRSGKNWTHLAVTGIR